MVEAVGTQSQYHPGGSAVKKKKSKDKAEEVKMLVVRLKKQPHDRLKAYSVASGRSIQHVVEQAITQYVDRIGKEG